MTKIIIGAVMPSCGLIFLVFYILIMVMMLSEAPNDSIIQVIFAQSSSFAYQEIDDANADWKEATTLNSTSGSSITDILSVSCFSNGRILDATIWLSNSLYEKSLSKSNSSLVYGMFIDADFNKNTGMEGIDYNIAINGENKINNNNTLSKVWTKISEQWSSNIPLINRIEKRAFDKVDNLTGFFANGKKFVHLSLDLEAIGSPEHYRILFYTQERSAGIPWKVDFTNWINFPPPIISVSTQPSAVDLIAGENKTIELQVRSPTGFKPEVNLYTINLPPGIESNFAYDKLNVSSYGLATTPMSIKVWENVDPIPYTITILTNSTIPPESVDKTLSDQSGPFNILPLKKENIENITTLTSLVMTVQPPVTWYEQLRRVVVDWQWLIAIGIGIVIDRFIPWEDKVIPSLTKIKQRFKK